MEGKKGKKEEREEGREGILMVPDRLENVSTRKKLRTETKKILFFEMKTSIHK